MRLSPGKNQPEHDLVYTPRPLAKQIVDHFLPQIDGEMLDPCMGNGAFLDNFPNSINGLVFKHYYCEVSMGYDFFNFNEKVSWIISNPPWSKIRQFLKHSYEIADNIVYLITINHMMTKARLREMYEAGFAIKEIYSVKTPPKPWPASGFSLAAIHIQRGYLGDVKMSGEFG